MVGLANKINKFGNKLWEGTLTGLNLAQNFTPFLDAAGPAGTAVGTAINSLGSLFNGINEAMQVHAINKYIKEDNERVSKEVDEDNKRIHQEYLEAKNKRDREEKLIRENYLKKLEKSAPHFTQEEIDAHNQKYTPKVSAILNARKYEF
jgi:hypothetical protein